MENTVKQLEKQVEVTDQSLDNFASKIENVQKEFCQEGTNVEVNRLLQTVHDVKNDYQNLRKEILEVQDLQKQLSTSLQTQRRLMQTKFSLLKQRLLMNVPMNHINHHNADNASALPPNIIQGGE